jgi:hypothetical protein
MADFEMNSEDLASTGSIARKIGSQFYPNGNVVIKNTTLSRTPLKDRSLRSADPARILQGDGLYRNPAVTTAAYIQSTQSALHGTLAARADIGDIKVPDPNDPTGKTLLSGAEARNEIIKRSSISTGLAPSGFESTVSALNRSVVGIAGSDGTDSGTMTNADGSTYSHSSNAYASSDAAGVLNGFNRDLAIIKDIPEQERQVYESKINEIRNKVNYSGDLGKFNIDLSKISSFSFRIKQNGTFFGGGRNASTLVSEDYAKLGKQDCYPAAALIELVSQLTNKIYMDGYIGTSRGFVSSNFKELTAQDNAITDHTFGRALDIFYIGYKKENAYSLATRNLDTFRNGLDIFLKALQTIPQDLHPDTIIFHSGLFKEMGINEGGLEDASSGIRVKYPGLSPFTNFWAHGSHDDHLHISFSSKRGGSFVVPSTVAASSTGSGRRWCYGIICSG